MEKADNKCAPAVTPPNDLAQAIAKTFVESTLYVFKIQSNLQIDVGTITKVVDRKAIPEANLFARLIIKGDPNINVTLLLGFSKKTFLGLASHVLGQDIKEITDENKDLATEFLNMIYGVMKSKLKDQGGFAIKMAIPEVVGVEAISPSANSNSLLIPFKLPYGEFVGLMTF